MKLLDGKTILIVDDEKDLCEMVADEFQFAGANTLMAFSGNTAYEIVKNQKVDAIVSDVNMPDGNGVDLLKKVVADNTTYPFVLFMTGYSDYTIEEAYDFGVRAVFSKPCNLDLVVKKASQLLLPLNKRLAAPVSEPKVHLEQQVDTNKIQIGHGGFFIPLQEINLNTNDSVSFKFPIKNSQGEQTFEGSGFIRWVRAESNEGLAPGLGLEWEYLNPEAIDFVEKHFKKYKTTAYIPIK